MKLIPILILGSSFITVNSEGCKKQPYVEWSETKRLQWKDFKAEKDRFSNFIAASSVQLKLSYNIGDYVDKYDVICFFEKAKSWTIDTTIYGLTHEQGHFDIGEINARRLRKAVLENQYKINRGNSKKIDSIFNYYQMQLKEAQDEYDKDTRHSMDTSEQRKWNHRIERQLDSLKKYQRQKS